MGYKVTPPLIYLFILFHQRAASKYEHYLYSVHLIETAGSGTSVGPSKGTIINQKTQ